MQFDAHADLRKYYGKSYLSHASVMRNILKFTSNIVQVGIRSLSEGEYNFARDQRLDILWAREMHCLSTSQILERILSSLTNKVYITFDLDYFSLDVISDTGTPEPGGLGWFKTLDILEGVFKNTEVVGMDFVELISKQGYSSSAFSTALLIKKCLVYKFFNNNPVTHNAGTYK